MPDRPLLESDLKRRLAEQARALSACEARYEAVFNSSITFMSICTVEGVVLDVSGSSLALGGTPIEELVGKQVWDTPLYAPNPEQAAQLEMAIKQANGRVVQYESRLLAPDNDWRVFDLVIRPVRGSVGAPSFIVLEARELTAMRKAEERARRAERMEALGLLTGGIAHDFNNFLTVVIGALDMVVRDPARTNRDTLIEAALEAAQKAEALNKQLLAFGRRAAFAAEQADVGAALHNLEPLLKKAVGEAVNLHVRASADRQHVRLELAQFEAAVLNLCINARDAMPSGGGIEIAVRLATPNEQELIDGKTPAVTIEISDTGTGIKPEILPRVFDPFFTTKEAGRGTGLGLSQVYGFARQTGGAVDVISASGRGSTFKLVLPCAPEGAPAPDVSAGPARPLAITSALLVEDDHSVADVASAMLAELGLEVVMAGNGPEAQRSFENRSFDLVVTDVVMPGGLNGLQLAEWIRRQRPETKVLLISGWTADALTAPADVPILQKPFDLKALELAIQNIA
jgi:PAS domain S-box-containing protein